MEIGEFLSRWCVWLLSVSFPICEKTLTWILMFHLYQRCFSKLAVLVFYSADKKKKKVTVSAEWLCWSWCVIWLLFVRWKTDTHNLFVKTVLAQLKNTSKDTDNVLSKVQQTRAQIYAQMVPRIQGRGRGEREPFHVVICGAVAAYGCELIHWHRFDLKFQDVDGYTCSTFPTKKPHECCLDVSVGRKTLGSENFSGIEKKIKKQNCFFGHVCLGGNKVWATWAKQTNTRTKTLCGQWTTLLTFNTTHMFIFSSLDCNLRLLLTFHSSSANSKLIQNAAAFAPTKTYRCSLIIPVCGSLHWLPWFSGFMLNPSINYIQRSGYLPPPNVHRYFHHSWCVLLIWAVPHLL